MSKEADGGSQAQCSPLRSTCSQPPCLASRCTRLNRGNSCGPRGGSLSPTRNVCRRDPKVSFVTGRLPVDEPDQERTDRHQQANANGVNFSTPITTKLIDCSPFVIMGNTMPPRDPEDDEKDEDEDEEQEERDDEPPVVREPEEED